MRSHTDIIRSAGVEAIIARTGLSISVHTVRSWQQRDAIPGEYWALLERSGIATVADLSEAAEARKLSRFVSKKTRRRTSQGEAA